ncbi:MAG TPA: Ig-like domain-containing protein, partial [Acidobacteriota bacterium]|nr:Ig-like domain-containing protein [Acidobacteriota bacterium]
MTQPLDLKYRVREIPTPPVPVDPSVTPIEVLDPVQTEQLLNRLPPGTPLAPNETGVFLPEKSLPLPKAGKVIESEFSPGEPVDQPDLPPIKPLEVLRVTPVGEVEVAHTLTVHFSEPMVALSGFSEMVATQSIVTLDPQPPGRWRWAGTHTLMFEPEAERFPMATLFRVTIPAGIQSSSGNVLAKSKEWTFQTLPPRLQASFPTKGTYPLQPVLFLEFDQQIDPTKVLPFLSLEVGTQRFPVKFAAPDQIGEPDQPLSKLLKKAKAGRWILFQPVNPLPNDAEVTVRLTSGTPSAEGSLVTTTDLTFSFHTLGPLRLVSYPCMNRKECLPDNWLFFTFSNELNKETFVPEMVTVVPSPADLDSSVSNTNLILMGTFAEDTTYTVQFSGELSDTSGQKLGQTVEVTLKFGQFGPFLSTNRKEMVILDPAGERVFELTSYRVPKLRVQLFRVMPEDWSQFVVYRSSQIEQKKNAKSLRPPGQLVSDEMFDIPESNMGRVKTTRIDLSPALTDGLGHVVLMVDPIGVERTSRNYTEILWIQSTNLAADVVADQDGLLVWANTLAEGKPVVGGEVTLFPAGNSSQTDHQGLAFFPYSTEWERNKQLLIVRKDTDSALLPGNYTWWSLNAYSPNANRQDQLRWFVFDDRKLYQPGEVLKLKGWIRQLETKKGGDLISGKWFRELVAYQVHDAAGRSLAKGALRLNVFGGFDGSISIPTNADLGEASVSFTLRGTIAAKLGNLTYRHPFDIYQFRRPEYELKVTTSDGPHLIGTSALATVFAGYFAGGPLKKAETQWNCWLGEGQYE